MARIVAALYVRLRRVRNAATLSTRQLCNRVPDIRPSAHSAPEQ
jgi:hypothetical protein